MITTSWRKSSRSTNSGDQNCVEVRLNDGRIEVRDSKLGDDSPIFGLTPGEFEALKGAAQR